MNDSEIDDDLIDEVRDQFRTWAKFLNDIIGLMAFTFGLACLGTPIPWISGVLSLMMLILLRWQGKHLFPAKINELRNEAKFNNEAKERLEKLESEFLSIRSLILNCPVFLFGFAFLSIVIASPLLSIGSPELLPYLSQYFRFQQ